MLVIGADSITITEPEAIDLPSSSTEGGDEEGIALLAVDTAWAVYQAEVLDQFGRPLPDEAVIWDILDGPHTGISLSRNGELSITPEAAPGIYTIVAISASDKNVMAFCEIELVAPETDENDEDPGDEPGEDPAPTDEDPAPGDDEPGDDEPGDGEPGDGEPGDGEPGDGEAGDGEPGDGEPGDGEPGDNTAVGDEQFSAE